MTFVVPIQQNQVFSQEAYTCVKFYLLEFFAGMKNVARRFGLKDASVHIDKLDDALVERLKKGPLTLDEIESHNEMCRNKAEKAKKEKEDTSKANILCEIKDAKNTEKIDKTGKGDLESGKEGLNKKADSGINKKNKSKGKNELNKKPNSGTNKTDTSKGIKDLKTKPDSATNKSDKSKGQKELHKKQDAGITENDKSKGKKDLNKKLDSGINENDKSKGKSKKELNNALDAGIKENDKSRGKIELAKAPDPGVNGNNKSKSKKELNKIKDSGNNENDKSKGNIELTKAPGPATADDDNNLGIENEKNSDCQTVKESLDIKIEKTEKPDHQGQSQTDANQVKGIYSLVSSTDTLFKAQIRPSKMLGLIWIQSGLHSYGIPERIYKKNKFRKY